MKKEFLTLWLIYQYNYYNKKYGDKEDTEIYAFGRKYLGLSDKETYKYLFKMADNQAYIADSSGYWYNFDASLVMFLCIFFIHLKV